MNDAQLVDVCRSPHPRYMGVYCNRMRHPGDYEHVMERTDAEPTTWQTPPDERAITGDPTVLEEAQQLIYGDRVKDYGPPTDSFTSIATLWNAYLETRLDQNRAGTGGAGDITLTATDVAHLMILMKVSRNTTGGYKRDNAVDLAGYAGCIERIEEGK